MNSLVKIWRTLQKKSGDWGRKVFAFFARCEEDERVRGLLFLLLLCLIGSIMLLLNSHTPLMMDDYDYSFSWATGERLSGFSDVITSQAVHYMIWGGRSVVHTFAQLFLYWGKGAFNVANTLMYLLLLLEIYVIAAPGKRRFCYPILLAAHLSLFSLIPFFGTVFLWLDGACNYLWGTVLALVPLILHKKAIDGVFRVGHAAGWIALPVCFLAGWTNENTACAVFAVAFLLVMISILEGKKVHIQQWMWLAAQFLGIAVMLLAPGNFARASEVSGRSLVLEMAYRFAVVTVYTLAYTAALGAAVLLLCGLLRTIGAKMRMGWAAALVLCAVLCAYALCASPLISDRSFSSVIVLMIAAACVLLGDLEEHLRSLDGFKIPALMLLSAVLVFGGYSALGDVRTHETAWNTQLARIEEARQQEKEAQIESVVSHSPYTMSIQIEKMPDVWPNSTLSKYFGIQIGCL